MPRARPSRRRRRWLLDGEKRAEAIDRLVAWVDQVFRPGFGQRPLCLFILDWLRELHLVLYMRPRRIDPCRPGRVDDR
jgi:hypothetical protein